MESTGFTRLEELVEKVLKLHYMIHPANLAALFVATRLGRPVLLEGPPGAGKTELAKVMAEAMDTELIRLQCYDGIKTRDAIGRFDYRRQGIHLQKLYRERGHITPGELAHALYTPDFLIKGPVLKAILRPKPVVLLIDEIDKVSGKFEAALLEVLSDWTVSLPEMDESIRAASRPLVILTSNGARELTEPLLRRCIYLWLDYPTLKQEVEILRSRASEPHAQLDTQIAGHAAALRTYLLEKAPSVSEMLMLKEALLVLGIDEIGPEHRDLVLPYVIKKKSDRNKMTEMREAFKAVLANTNKFRTELVKLRQLEEWQKMREADGGVFEAQIAAIEKDLDKIKRGVGSILVEKDEAPRDGRLPESARERVAQPKIDGPEIGCLPADYKVS